VNVLFSSKQRDQKLAVILRLNRALAKFDSDSDIAEYAPVVAAAFKGVDYAVFESIDNDIGNAARGAPDKGYLVRRVRNNPPYGRPMFAGLVR
jgi:hypothetical protein